MWCRWLRSVWAEMLNLRAMVAELRPSAKSFRMRRSLLGERLDRCVMGLVVGERNQVSGDVDHAVEPLLVTPALVDVALQPHEEPASRALVVEEDCRDIHPDPAPRWVADLQVEIRDPAGRSVPATGRRFRTPGDRR